MTRNTVTPIFMAPKVDKGHYDCRSIVYSAGFLFSEFVRLIKEGQHVEGISFETEIILHAMLSVNPSDRLKFIEVLYHIFGINDYLEKSLFLNNDRCSDCIHYKRLRSNIGLFDCLKFHYFYSSMDKVGELSHLGQFMSIIFDHIVLF